MSKRLRQYTGLLSSIAAYYIIHEGAHLMYALSIGVFKQIDLMGLGMQIDVYANRMTPAQMGIFCLAGSIATAVIACILTVSAGAIASSKSPVFKSCMYYITIAMLFIDPLYLSLLCGFLGGGDMNGICLLLPEAIARMIYGCMLATNMVIFFKEVLPKYKAAFE